MSEEMKLLLVCIGLLLVFANTSWALCVKSSGANLRKGPGPKYALTWTVDKYMPLVEIERKGSWYKVEDLDGETHWIYKDLITKSIRCMAVRSSLAALRKGPGLEEPYSELPTVGKYFSFKRIGFEPPWYQVEDAQGDAYWIHESNLWLPLQRTQISF